jgi:hypothetical protein
MMSKDIPKIRPTSKPRRGLENKYAWVKPLLFVWAICATIAFMATYIPQGPACLSTVKYVDVHGEIIKEDFRLPCYVDKSLLYINAEDGGYVLYYKSRNGLISRFITAGVTRVISVEKVSQKSLK